MKEQSIPKRNGGGLSVLLGLTLLGLLFLMWIALAYATRTFWTANNMANLLRQTSFIAILAIGQTFVIITAGIDLSVGAVEGFISMMVAWLLTHNLGFASTIFGAVTISLLIGAAIGVFHGFGVVQLGLPPFIMTLATMYALRGIGLLITNGATISIDNTAFTHFSRQTFLGFPWTDGSWFQIPSLVWMVVLVAVPAYVFLNHSRWGRYLFAIGSNKEAARLSGVNVKLITYVAYILSSLLAAFVGVLLATRIGIGNPTQGQGDELQAIASSVIGGASLFGAVGSIHGPLIGALILQSISNGANLLNVNSFWQTIITGALIIVVVYFDSLQRARRG
jgi:ribose transport system permease protein